MKRLVEIRAYALKPGTRPAFHEAMSQGALPMLKAAGMDVVAHGPAPHDESSYVLVRAFDDAADRQRRQDDFYGSPAWRGGPREALVSRIETSIDSLLWLSPAAIDELREPPAGAG